MRRQASNVRAGDRVACPFGGGALSVVSVPRAASGPVRLICESGEAFELAPTESVELIGGVT